MTKALRLCACFVLITVGVPRPAAADWQLAPFFGFTLDGSTTFPDLENVAAGRAFGRGDRVFGAAITRIGRRPIGVEGIVAYVPGIFDQGAGTVVLSSRSIAAMGNLVVSTPRWSGYGLRPFVSGGLGLLHVAQVNFLNALSFRRNVVGYNIGGGAVGPLSDRTGLRFDIRRFSYLRPGETQGFSLNPACTTSCDENLSYWTASVGFVFRVGR